MSCTPKRKFKFALRKNDMLLAKGESGEDVLYRIQQFSQNEIQLCEDNLAVEATFKLYGRFAHEPDEVNLDQLAPTTEPAQAKSGFTPLEWALIGLALLLVMVLLVVVLLVLR